MTAAERARLLGWDIDPQPPEERNASGRVIGEMIRKWNEEALKRLRRDVLTSRAESW